MVIPFLYAIPTQVGLMEFGLSNEMEEKDWWFYLFWKYPHLEMNILNSFLLPFLFFLSPTATILTASITILVMYSFKYFHIKANTRSG